MSKLSSVIENIYSSLNSEDIPVYREYEKIPVCAHEKIYAVVGISEIAVDSRFGADIGKHYREKYTLRIRILGLPEIPVSILYEILEEQLLDRLMSSEFFIEKLNIPAPVQDMGLKRIVLECKAEISGRMEV